MVIAAGLGKFVSLCRCSRGYLHGSLLTQEIKALVESRPLLHTEIVQVQTLLTTMIGNTDARICAVNSPEVVSACINILRMKVTTGILRNTLVSWNVVCALSFVSRMSNGVNLVQSVTGSFAKLFSWEQIWLDQRNIIASIGSLYRDQQFCRQVLKGTKRRKQF